MPKGIYDRKPLSEEHKRNISLALKGKPSWSEGKHLSEETKKKMSNTAKLKGFGLWMRGKKLSENTKKKISDWSTEHETFRRLPLTFGDNNINWKGDEVKYRALHAWINRRLGRSGTCEACNDKSENKTYDRANISRTYKRKIDDWISLCRSCHRKFDNNNLTVKELKQLCQRS